MRNVLILGTGRSGTSLVASLFRDTHYQGDDYIPPRRANPHGFFEDSVVNAVNDEILARGLLTIRWSRLPRVLRHRVFADPWSLWLAAPVFTLPRRLTSGAVARIRERVGRRPFCYKDPRFTFTLRHWRPFLPPDTRFVVVFRRPAHTVTSMLREARESYSPPLRITRRQALAAWRRAYRRLLAMARADADWFFVRYEDVLSGRVVPALSRFTETRLNDSLVDPAASRTLRRPAAGGPVPRRHERLWKRLVARAGEDISRWR